MTRPQQSAEPYHFKGLLSPFGQAVLLGGTGFVAGYVFPLWRTPDANQGPLLGFFFTGPFGFLVGLALGRLGERLQWRRAAAALVMIACSVLLGVATYLMCEPDDLWIAELVDGTVTECSPPIAFIDEVLKQWENSIAINPQKTVAESWREDVRNTLSSSSGYVATFRTERTREIYVGRRESNRGATYAAPWVEKHVTVRYFVSAEMCPTHSETKRGVYFTDWPAWPDRERFPPDDASRLFNFSVLKAVPSSHISWASP